MKQHLDPSQILALVRAAGPELRDGVLIHLARCPECARRLERAIDEVTAAERRRKMLSFDRAPAARTERPSETPAESPRVWWTRPRSGAAEIAAAERLLAELLTQPEGQRALIARNCERFHELALVELVLEEGRTACYDDPHRGGRLIELGISMIDLLDRDYHGRRLLDDLRGRGWFFRANAHRIIGDLADAEEEFRRSAELLEGSSSRIEHAGLLQHRASLRKAQNRSEEALEMLAEAAEIFEDEGEETKAGRVFASQGVVLLEMGEPEQAEQTLAEALVRIDASEDPLTLLGVRHSLIAALAYQERYPEAAELMAELAPEYDRFPDAQMQLRRRWIEGKILAGLGREEEAEKILSGVRREYLDGDLPLYAAYVSLELALLYERQGRHAKLRRLSEELTPVFFARDIPRETATALTFFVHAVEQERVSRVVIERVAGFLQRARSDPKLRFSDYP